MSKLYHQLALLIVISLSLAGCNEVKKYQEKGAYSLGDYELLDYRRKLIEGIVNLDRSATYNEIDARYNFALTNTFSRHGYNQAAKQAGTDLIGNIVVAYFEQKTLDDYYMQLYTVSKELKKRGWDGKFGFNKDQFVATKSGNSNSNNQVLSQKISATKKDKKIIGESSFDVEMKAKNEGCKDISVAELIHSQHSTELYKITCNNVDTLLYKCVFRDCKRLLQ